MPHDIVLTFWFEELQPAQWWRVDAALDQRIRKQFGALHQAAHAGELAAWREQPQGRLAEIIVLDQFSRNVFRDTPRAFAQDALALALAQELVAGGHDHALDTKQRAFAYMPYMHSESLPIHEQAVKLFDQPGLENNHDFELKHKAIIERFGRYPHRNDILGRPCTVAELVFLEEPGSSF